MLNLALRTYKLNPYALDDESGVDFELKEACQDDKQRFAEEFLSEHITVPFGQHHKEWLSSSNQDERLQAIAAPRGSAKTTVFSLVDVLHAICYHTEDYIVIISETVTMAIDRVADIKREIENNDKIRQVFGDLVGSKWRENDIMCANGVRVVAKGRGGQIRGGKSGPDRPSLIILDDVESSESVLSPDQREKVKRWYETDVRRAGRIVGRPTNFRVIGTYLHQDALLPRLVENPGYHSKVYKAVLSWSKREDLWEQWRKLYTDLTRRDRHTKAREFYETHETQMLDGVEMLWPDGLNYYTVMEAIVTDGLYAVMKEFQNEPYDPTLQIFDMEKAQKFSVEREGLLRDDGRMVKWDNIVGASGFWDWSGGKESGDFAAIAVILWEAFPHTGESYGYCVDVWLDKVAPSRQVTQVFELFAKWNFQRFGTEKSALDEFLQKAFADEKRRRAENDQPHNFMVHGVDQTRNKLDRIASLEPAVANGWLLFNRALSREFIEQMTQFPTHGYDDGPDALEGAYQIKVTKRQDRRQLVREPRQWRTFELR